MSRDDEEELRILDEANHCYVCGALLGSWDFDADNLDEYNRPLCVSCAEDEKSTYDRGRD